MTSNTTRHGAANDHARPDRDAREEVDALPPRVGIADWGRYVENGGQIERTLTSDCDACGAITEVHVIGPCGGVLAFCVDPQACLQRQRAGFRAH